jgi:hypothetical protein
MVSEERKENIDHPPGENPEEIPEPQPLEPQSDFEIELHEKKIEPESKQDSDTARDEIPPDSDDIDTISIEFDDDLNQDEAQEPVQAMDSTLEVELDDDDDNDTAESTEILDLTKLNLEDKIIPATPASITQKKYELGLQLIPVTLVSGILVAIIITTFKTTIGNSGSLVKISLLNGLMTAIFIVFMAGIPSVLMNLIRKNNVTVRTYLTSLGMGFAAGFVIGILLQLLYGGLGISAEATSLGIRVMLRAVVWIITGAITGIAFSTLTQSFKIVKHIVIGAIAGGLLGGLLLDTLFDSSGRSFFSSVFLVCILINLGTGLAEALKYRSSLAQRSESLTPG